jgi:starvation-inducible outer membrane lipoprotein
MDTTVTAIIEAAEKALATQAKEDTTERDLFEQFMYDKFLLCKLDDTKLWYLRRDMRHQDRYAEPQMENMWWVWKSRAAVARGEQPEAYPLC